MNYRGDDAARKTILNTVFGNCETDEPQQILYQILCDVNYGPTFVYKVLSMPLLEDDIRIHIIAQVRKILMESNTAQHHRRLMEEVGLMTTGNNNNQTSNNKHRKNSSHTYVQDNNGHMRGVSVSSVRSGGSRQTGLTPNIPQTFQMPSLPNTSMSTVVSGNMSLNQLPTQMQQQQQSGVLPQTVQQQQQQPMVGSNQNNAMSYMNYPGVFLWAIRITIAAME